MSDPSYLDTVFSEGGLFAKEFPGYAPRAQQIELARAVDRALDKGSHLIAEAPTGVGKSLGYGVPAAYHASTKGRRVAIVTANIALQEQLAGKDLPLLQRVLPWRFTFALAKGINNYLCRYRHEESAETVVEWLPRVEPTLQRKWSELETWVSATERGDLSELAYELPQELRHRLTISSDDCLGSACRHKDDCFPRAARKRYREAQVVVTNYHLFFSHLAVLRASEGVAGILPPVDTVIFDEGHNAAEIARDFFGFRVTAGSVRWAMRLLNPSQKGKNPKPVLDADLQRKVTTLADRFFAELKEHRSSKEYRARLRDMHPAQSTELTYALGKAIDCYRAAQVDERDSARQEELGKAARRAAAVSSQISEAMILGDEQRVYHIDIEGQRAALCAKQLDIAPVLRAELFDNEPHTVEKLNGQSVNAGCHAAVVTSATLAVSGNFDLVMSELGAEAAEELAVGSPFDLPKQALLVIPAGLPDPRDANRFAPSVGQQLIETVKLARGRTLALFTSYRVLNAAHAMLVGAGLPYAILRQGEAPRTKLIKAFKADTSSVLLGTDSLWEGVDVPGEALSCVFMDKLPFASPDDPVEDALSEKLGSRYFKQRMLPQAVIAFRQGFGRLVRTTTDRGVVVCCDRRLTDKPYGKTFIRALGGVRVSHNIDDVGIFLDAARAA